MNRFYNVNKLQRQNAYNIISTCRYLTMLAMVDLNIYCLLVCSYVASYVVCQSRE